MSERIKSCPFCGGKVKKVIAPLMQTVMFICKDCGADVCFYGGEHDPIATERWNQRIKEQENEL